MDLGVFSLSLAVKDLGESKLFYEHLGFKVVHGVEEQNWLILRNDEVTIGLFQGMFDENILTFNPGWDKDAQETETFTDVREIQRNLKEAGIDVGNLIDPSTKGRASFTITDPDGNTILIDQHR